MVREIKGRSMTVDVKKLARWNNWLDAILADLQWVLMEQEVYDEFVLVFNANAEHISAHGGRTFCDSIRTWYASFAGFAIRRHCDNDGRKTNRSLRSLLNNLSAEAGEFTYRRYMEFFPLVADPTECPWQELTFRDFADDGDEITPDTVLSAAKIQADIDKLENMRVVVASYIDRLWAHLDKRGAADSGDGTSFTFGTLNEGLNLIGETTNKYLGLFNRGMALLRPVRTYGWTGIFDVPLRAPSDAVSGDNGEDAT